MHQFGVRLVMALTSLILVAGGLAIAANFRGFTEWHVRKSFGSVQWLEGPLSRIPPWKPLLRLPREERIARQVRRERVMGAIFALMGVVLLVASVFARGIHAG